MIFEVTTSVVELVDAASLIGCRHQSERSNTMLFARG